MKQRLVGAAVLVALAVIFLPMLVKGPAPDSGVSDLSLDMPDAPGGDYVTRDLPLVTPGAASPTELGGDRLPMVDTGIDGGAGTGAPAAPADAEREAAAAVAAPAEPATTTAAEMFPAATAGGDYAVSFGTYASRANAVAMVGDLRASQLPGYSEAGRVDGKDVWRVRIGPYATRADAEAARLRAMHVRDDLDARVVVLDAAPAATTPAPATATPAPAAPTPPAAPAPAAAAVGFAVQVGAFSRSADAAALRDRLRGAGFNAFTESVETDKGALTRVKAGPVLSRADADQLKAQLKSKLGLDGIVRTHP